ncbi:MAG: HAMP domain-containing histidine kinase [Archangiaceae bacterium]|nr:HAMP domain-containing histidine kinase [Archangiaceae bacterium]
MPVSALSAPAREWVDEQISKMIATAWAIRAGVATAVLSLSYVLDQGGLHDWGEYLEPLAVYSVMSAGFAWASRRFDTTRYAALAAALDVAMISLMQWRTMPQSPHPAGVAGFTLGLFVLLVAVNGLALKPFITWSTALFSAVGVSFLMQQAQVGFGAQAVAAVVLGVTAIAIEGFSKRLFGLAAAVAKAEVDRDVQSRRFAEVEAARATIEERNRQLETLQAERDALTHVLVHDLRSPISVIASNVTWAEQELQRPLSAEDLAEVRSALHGASTTTDRLNAMVTDLLTINKLEEGELPLNRENVDARAMLETLQQQYTHLAEQRRVKLEVHASARRALDADRGLLTRVVENLVSNALRYTPSGGRLRVESFDTEDGLALAVRNDGDPIPNGARTVLFEKFSQLGNAAERRTAGFGLGLYFCRLVAERHGGTIAVEDAESWATSMVLRLPQRALADQSWRTAA